MRQRWFRVLNLFMVFVIVAQVVIIPVPAYARARQAKQQSSQSAPSAPENPMLTAPDIQDPGISASSTLRDALAGDGVAVPSSMPAFAQTAPASFAAPHRNQASTNVVLPRRQQEAASPSQVQHDVWQFSMHDGSIINPMDRLPAHVREDYEARHPETATQAKTTPTAQPSPTQTSPDDELSDSTTTNQTVVYLPIVTRDSGTPGVTKPTATAEAATTTAHAATATTEAATSTPANSATATALAETATPEAKTPSDDSATATAQAATATTVAQQTATAEATSPDGEELPPDQQTTVPAAPTSTTGPSQPAIIVTPQQTVPVTTTRSPEETPVISSDVVEMTVSPDKGGTLTSHDGSVQLLVPTGAVTKETTIRFAPMSPQTATDHQAVGPFFQLLAWDSQGNRITHFLKDITITVHYTPTPGIEPYALSLFYFKDNSYWQYIPSTINTATHQVVAKVDHFTEFVVDEFSKGFTRGGTPAYWKSGNGFSGHMYWTCVNGNTLDNWGVWRPEITVAGDFDVYAFIPATNAETTNAPYKIHYSGGQVQRVSISQITFYDQWVLLGTFPFEAGTSGYVRLTDVTGERCADVIDLHPGVGFDAMAWVPAGSGIPSGGGGIDGLPPLSPEMRALLRRLGVTAEWLLHLLDPVSSSGNFVQQKTDLYVPGVAGFDLDLTRTYNSQDERDGPFGFGWSSILSMSLRIANDGSVDVRYPDGHGAWFKTDDGTTYVPGDKGIYDTLTLQGDELVLTTPDQITYHFHNLKGHLLSMKDRHDNTITFERDDDGKVTSIIDSAGRTYTLAYDETHVTSITDPAGRTLTYQYSDEGDLINFTDANGGVHQYAYEDEHLLVSLTDPEGITYLKNTYDDERRVIEQLDADGSLSTASYSESQTVFTDNLNNATTLEIDDRHRVTKITDALGNSEISAYDENDNVTSYTDKNGETWTTSYDSQGNPLSETDPQGFTVSYTYNATNDLLSMTDMGGPGNTPRTTNLERNGQGDITSIKQPDGTTIAMSYDNAGQMLTLTLPNGNTTTLSYDGEGNLVDITDPLSNKSSYSYDSVGRMTAMTDANGHTVSLTYDNNDNITSITDPKNQTISMTYDGNDLLTRMEDRRGGVWTYAYDENLKLVAETDPEGDKTTHAYDKMYNRISSTDPRGNTTTYRYDAIYQLVEIEDALHGTTTLAYDPNGNLTSVTNALNHTTAFAYDTKNQITKITDALNGTTTMTYDAVGRLTSETNPRSATTSYVYDLLDRLVQTTDALNGTWKIGYDANGNPTSSTDANVHTTTMRYDSADRLIEAIDPEGHTTQYAYDAVGNLIAVTNGRGYVSRYDYDANDNLVKVTEPKVIDGQHAITTAAYDAEDEVVALTDPNGHTTRFNRNLDGLIIKLTEAGGQETLFDYDATHNMVKLTNAKGNAWTFTYDALNRRTSETDPLNHTTQFVHDAISRPIRTIDANTIATRYDYDALNRLIAVVQNEQAGAGSDHETNVTTRYGYDAVGNLVAITDANNHTTTFDYDLLNRLTQETDPLSNTWVYTYDAVGNMITRTDGEKQTTVYAYDKDDLLIQTSYPDGSSISYAYDEVHNQTVMTDTIGVTVNTFDEVDQLLTSTMVPTTLISATTKAVTYTYDLDGNITRFAHPDGREVQYLFDTTDYMTGVIDPDMNMFVATRDATHNIVRVDNPNDTFVERDIDAAERLTAVRNYTNQNPTHEIISNFEYTLDPVGNRTRVESEYRWRKPVVVNYDYTYDPLYRLTRSVDNQGHFTNYGYDAVGNRLLHITNDDPTLKREVDVMTTTLTFNGANEMLTSVTEVQPRGNADRATQAAQALRAFVHEVSAQSGKHIASDTATTLAAQATTLLTALEDNKAPTIEAAAADIASLRAAVESAGEAGTIDNAGIINSLLVKLRNADEANADRGPELHVSLYDYDRNGNRIRRTEHRTISATKKDWNRTDYFYDYENRLKHVQDYHTPGVPGNGKWLPMDETFVFFDGYGRVYRRQHDQHIGGGGDQEWIDYAYDGLDPIAEYRHPSHQYTNYHRGFGHILSMHKYKSQASPVGTLYYFHYDGLDSVTGITKHQGQSVHNLRYHDYGILLDINGQAADSSNFTDPHNHYSYTGQEWDEHIDLYHFYARDYEPATGVWLQRDPYRGRLAEPKTLHRYGYVGQGPVTYRDWWGYLAEEAQVVQRFRVWWSQTSTKFNCGSALGEIFNQGCSSSETSQSDLQDGPRFEEFVTQESMDTCGNQAIDALIPIAQSKKILTLKDALSHMKTIKGCGNFLSGLRKYWEADFIYYMNKNYPDVTLEKLLEQARIGWEDGWSYFNETYLNLPESMEEFNQRLARGSEYFRKTHIESIPEFLGQLSEIFSKTWDGLGQFWQRHIETEETNCPYER